ncbi:MAG TPA: hypothetical protein VLL76_04250 [Candidatus Omnitrophota bacterium]|nr:hypothetical protein [Candidatus Omnitrophota bacterium]
MMRKLVVSALVLASVALSAPAGAADPKPKAGAKQQHPQAEVLLMLPPKGWQAVPGQKTDQMSVTRLYPPGQSEKQWTEMITVQIQPGSDMPPRAYLDTVVAYSRANCEMVGPGPVTEAPINNYPSASGMVQCTKGKQSGQGNVVMVTAIKGRDGLYVVQRQWRGKPFTPEQKPDISEATLKSWTAFARTIGLCDPRDAKNHPCP